MATGSLTTAVLFMIVSLSLFEFHRAQTISVIRIAPGQYEAVEGRHDEAIATSVLKNDVNETGYVYTIDSVLCHLFSSCHHQLGIAGSAWQF